MDIGKEIMKYLTKNSKYPREDAHNDPDGPRCEKKKNFNKRNLCWKTKIKLEWFLTEVKKIITSMEQQRNTTK